MLSSIVIGGPRNYSIYHQPANSPAGRGRGEESNPHSPSFKLLSCLCTFLPQSIFPLGPGCQSDEKRAVGCWDPLRHVLFRLASPRRALGEKVKRSDR